MKYILLLLALLCAIPAAADESLPEPDEPLARDPASRYELYLDATDGSDVLVFSLLDSLNDENEGLDEGGSLVLESDVYDENGVYSGVTMRQELFRYNGLAVMRAIVNVDPGLEQYYTGSSGVHWDGTTAKEIDGYPDFSYLWDMWHYPYVPSEMMHGMRQDGTYSYFLMAGVDGSLLEYVTDSGMSIVQTRVYYPDSNGEQTLLFAVSYSRGTAPEVPEEVAALLAAEQPGEKPAAELSDIWNGLN